MDTALWSTVGELTERYCGMIIDTTRLIMSSYDDLGCAAVSPNRFILFSDEQYENNNFPFIQFKEDTQIYWTKAIEYPSGNEVLVPSEFVWLGSPTPNGKYLDAGYSTGLACGQDPKSASVSGMREVIERDSYMCYFQTKTPPPRLPLNRVMPHLSEGILERLRNQNIVTQIFDVTSDLGVPSVLTHMRFKHHRNRGISTGLCSSLDPRAALEKSILECYQTLNWMLELNRGPRIELSEVRGFEDHVKYYMDDSRLDDLAFMFDSSDESTMFDFVESSENTLEKLIRVIEGKGYSSYFVDCKRLINNTLVINHPAR